MPQIEFELQEETLTIRASGSWLLADLPFLLDYSHALPANGYRLMVIDLSRLERLDSAGAWMIARLVHMGKDRQNDIKMEAIPQHLGALLKRVLDSSSIRDEQSSKEGMLVAAFQPVIAIGRYVTGFCKKITSMTAFFGALVLALISLIWSPQRLRWRSVSLHIQRAGWEAIPIVALLSAMIGVVLAFQGFDQLRQFGAEIFTINLVAISVLREMGVLLTAILVAGRSSSAFAAQIGTMQLNEEVAAIRAMGLSPMDLLVLPRVLALLVSLPLLAFFADILGIAGGMLMVWVVMDIPFAQFLENLRQIITPSSFWIGISKAPFFALLIAMIGCYEGFKVEGGAESVGRMTTLAVVESIFVVIVLDALFSVYFSKLGV